MLHILLLMLKVIGIILAVILGILVLLVCTVIFVPVRYEVNAKCGGKLSTLKIKGRVTWLFSLVRADIYYKENKLKWRLRIAWKKIFSQNESTEGNKNEEIWKGHESDEDDEKVRRIEAGEDEECDEEIQRSEAGEGETYDEKACRAEAGKGEAYDQASENDEKARHESGKDEKDRERLKEKFGEDKKIYQEILESMEEEYSGDEEEDQRQREACEDGDSEDGGWLKGIVRKIKDTYSRIKCTIRDICDKIKELAEKKDNLLSFIRDETHMRAFRRAKKETVKLLRRLRPKKFAAEVQFGFDDPSWTGRTLAAAAPLYPLFGEYVTLRPDFTEKKLSGRLYGKGRIRLYCFATLAWNLLRSSHVRRTYKDIRNFKI